MSVPDIRISSSLHPLRSLGSIGLLSARSFVRKGCLNFCLSLLVVILVGNVSSLWVNVNFNLGTEVQAWIILLLHIDPWFFLVGTESSLCHQGSTTVPVCSPKFFFVGEVFHCSLTSSYSPYYLPSGVSLTSIFGPLKVVWQWPPYVFELSLALSKRTLEGTVIRLL